MPRPKSRSKIIIFPRKGSPYWYISFVSDVDGKRKQKSTGRLVSEYSKAQLREMLDSKTGTKRTAEYSVGWFCQHIYGRLELERANEGTIKEYRKALEHLREIYGSGFSILKIDKTVQWRLKEYLTSKNYSNATINKELRHLRASLERVVDDELLPRNPLKKFKKMPETEKNIALTDGDLQKFLSVVDVSKLEAYRRLVYIYLYTGVRRCELLVIPRSEINTPNNDTWEMWVMNSKKAGKPKRLITIQPKIHEHVQWFLDNSSGEFPFGICKPDALTRRIKIWLREAGLDEKYHFHSLRHTFASRAVNKGNSNIYHVQQHMGHSVITVTAGYVHKDADQGRVIDIGL